MRRTGLSFLAASLVRHGESGLLCRPIFNTIDVFVIQATTNTLCAHFISLLSTLSLLARIREVVSTQKSHIIQIGRVVGRLHVVLQRPRVGVERLRRLRELLVAEVLVFERQS